MSNYIDVKQQLVSRSLQPNIRKAHAKCTCMQYFPNISLVHAGHGVSIMGPTFALASYACFIRSSPSSISGPNTP